MRTSSEAILVLNADTVLEARCVGRLLDALEADDGLAGVQPLILQLEEAGQGHGSAPTIYSAGQSLTPDGRAFEEGAGAKRAARHLRRAEVFGVCGAACLLRRELFTELGGYDERYFAFYEDVDLNVRARIAGWSFETIPEAVAWHVGNAVWQAGFRNPKAENARLVARNRVATQLKFMSGRALPRIAAVEIGALAKSITRRRFRATATGKLEGLRWRPEMLRERRRLRETGDLGAARDWLGHGPRRTRDSAAPPTA